MSLYIEAAHVEDGMIVFEPATTERYYSIEFESDYTHSTIAHECLRPYDLYEIWNLLKADEKYSGFKFFEHNVSQGNVAEFMNSEIISGAISEIDGRVVFEPDGERPEQVTMLLF